MPLFSIPLSGLQASSEALSIISNNLANINTDSYKDQNVSFKDLFYQSMGTNGAGDPMQVGNGAAVASITSSFNNGSLNNTGVPTNMAISGDGFFVTQKAGTQQYTRDGNFTVNQSGQLVTQDGAMVLGYPAVNGVISANAVLGPLSLSQGASNPASATGSFSLDTNLDARSNVSDSFSTPLTIYDSLGNSHTLTFQFTKTGTGGWDYKVTLPGADTGNANDTTVTTGSLTFDANGNLSSPNQNITGISISGLVDGAATLNLTWDLFGAGGSSLLTQVAATSTTSQTNQDGYPVGTLQNFSVDASGIVEGTFSNGQSRQLGQVALADFSNDQGLKLGGGNNYTSTLASGDAVVGAPGTGGRGTITGGALELSNVDVATEFAKMIVAQRGYEANAKVVTAFDQVAQDTIALKQ